MIKYNIFLNGLLQGNDIRRIAPDYTAENYRYIYIYLREYINRNEKKYMLNIHEKEYIGI